MVDGEHVMTNKKKICMVGGGSAGHVFPALAIAGGLIERGWEIEFIGSRSGLERRLLAKSPLIVREIFSGKLRRYWSLRNFSDLVFIVFGFLQSLSLLCRFRPDVLFSKGGFVSVPVVYAAALLRIPTIAHESDYSPGLANRLAAPFLRTFCVTFSDTRLAWFRNRPVHTGNPVRAEFLSADPKRGRAFIGKDVRNILLILGGSQGAEKINSIVRESLAELGRHFLVVHICGPGKKIESSNGNYIQFEFVEKEMADLLSAAELVVSRAGSNSLFEIVAMRKPNLLIPLGLSSSRGDQILNARYAQERGWSSVIDEENLTSELFVQELLSLYENSRVFLENLSGFEPKEAVERIIFEIECLQKN